MAAETWVSFFRELGFASIIAFAVARSVEHTSRMHQIRIFDDRIADHNLAVANQIKSHDLSIAQQVETHNQAVEKQMQRIAESVFKGVFNTSTPRKVYEEIEIGILRLPFQRREFKVRYKIVDSRRGRDDNEYLVVSVRVDYYVANISTSRQKYAVGVEIEKPSLSDFKDIVGVKKVRIDGVPLPANEMEEAKSRGKDTNAFFVFSHEIDIESQTEVDISISYVVIKRVNENEIMQVLHGTQTMSLSMEISPKDFEYGAYSIHRTELTEDRDDEFPTWKIKDVLLPHQGMHIWWRKRSPDTRQLTTGG